MTEKMDVFNNTDLKDSKTEGEVSNITAKSILEYNSEVQEGSKETIVKFLETKGFSGLCYIEKLATSNTSNLALIQSYFGDRKLFVSLKGDETLIPCHISVVLKQTEKGMRPNVKVFIDEEKIKLADIDNVAVNLDESAVPVVKKDTDEEKIAEILKGKKLDPTIEAIVVQAIKAGLDYEYVMTISPKYKYLDFIIPALEKKVHITDYVKNDTPTDLIKVILDIIEVRASALSKLDLSRDANMLKLDLACLKAGFDLYDVYEESDDLKTAYTKLQKAVSTKNKQIYYASFNKENSSFGEFPENLYNLFVKVIAEKEEKELKNFDIRKFMIANDLIGIYKLPISIDEFVSNEELRMELNRNNSCLVSLNNTVIMFRNLAVADGELFAGVNKVEKSNQEYLYIECLPATKNQIEKSKEACMELALPVSSADITEELMQEYMNELNKHEGSFYPFTKVLRDKGFVDTCLVDLNADRETIAMCLENCMATVKWYDKNYGFRETYTKIIVTVAKSGGHLIKIKFDKFTIPFTKFVRVKLDVNSDSNSASELRNLMLSQYQDKLLKR